MRIALWKFVNEKIIAHLKRLQGHFFKKLFSTLFYGLCSALLILGIGALVFLITLIPVWEGALGIFLIYLLGVFLSYMNFIFESHSIAITAFVAITGGVVLWFFLMMSSAIFNWARYNSWTYADFGLYILLLTVMFSLFYWFYSDFRSYNTGCVLS